MNETPEAEGERFLELGLLLIVTGLSAVLVAACIMVLLFWAAPRMDAITVVLGAASILGAVLLAILIRRLYGFLVS